MEEKLKKICYKYLSKEFDNGTKCSPFDANNSEFELPRIDLSVVPEMVREIMDCLDQQ